MNQGFFCEFAESMACRGIVKLRRGLLLWPLVGPTRARPGARRVLTVSNRPDSFANSNPGAGSELATGFELFVAAACHEGTFLHWRRWAFAFRSHIHEAAGWRQWIIRSAI